MAAAEVTGADAIHPGYGFLSENANFAEVVRTCGLHFIGPRPEMLRLMGNKVQAREAAEKAGLPLLPGARGMLKDSEEAERIANEIGFPIILKAAAGGGGRGMKIVREAEHVRKAFETASTEAAAAFGDGSMYLERYVEEPRHIELQMVADEHGNVIHLGERECSVQRRHQKMVEEAPSPAVSPELRKEMGDRAVKALQDIGYNNVGTIEFLMDEKGRYYFMEMNTRIQVEHPVTEQVYGLDLLRLQIKLAAGDKLDRRQEDVFPKFHAIECRVNAEDPVKFVPSPGKITGYHQPGGYGVRVDTTVYEQYKVQPYYDSMVAKLICWADKREVAIERMKRALDEYVIEGIKTNIPFLKRVLVHPGFVAGKYDTRIVDQILAGNPRNDT
jgi:acetyl-CoA carboxylase biotin carboxylase subunit